MSQREEASERGLIGRSHGKVSEGDLRERSENFEDLISAKPEGKLLFKTLFENQERF